MPLLCNNSETKIYNQVLPFLMWLNNGLVSWPRFLVSFTCLNLGSNIRIHQWVHNSKYLCDDYILAFCKSMNYQTMIMRSLRVFNTTSSFWVVSRMYIHSMLITCFIDCTMWMQNVSWISSFWVISRMFHFLLTMVIT